jgi:hypothetical protein
MNETQKDLGEEIISALKELGEQLDELKKAFGELKNGRDE